MLFLALLKDQQGAANLFIADVVNHERTLCCAAEAKAYTAVCAMNSETRSKRECEVVRHGNAPRDLCLGKELDDGAALAVLLCFPLDHAIQKLVFIICLQRDGNEQNCVSHFVSFSNSQLVSRVQRHCFLCAPEDN